MEKIVELYRREGSDFIGQNSAMNEDKDCWRKERSLPLFQGASIDDIVFYSSQRNTEEQWIFQIRKDGLIDLEATIESMRWLSSHSVPAIPVMPVEPSSILSVAQMNISVLLLEPTYFGIGDVLVNSKLISYITDTVPMELWFFASRFITEQCQGRYRIQECEK